MSESNKLNGILDRMFEKMIVAEQDIEIGEHKIKEIILQVTDDKALLVWGLPPLGNVWCEFYRWVPEPDMAADRAKLISIQNLSFAWEARKKVAHIFCKQLCLEVPLCYRQESIDEELLKLKKQIYILCAKSQQTGKTDETDEPKKVNFREFL